MNKTTYVYITSVAETAIKTRGYLVGNELTLNN